MKVRPEILRGLERMKARAERKERWISQQAFDEAIVEDLTKTTPVGNG